MRSLVQKLWVPESRKTTVCVDSYRDGILQGRFYGPDGEPQPFPSLSRFLVLMEEMLDRINEPQADTTHRSFSAILRQTAAQPPRSTARKGGRATFELQILFRQHSSWQGTVLWQEKRMEQHFRSVLELILLMDSALGSPEEGETV